MECVGIHLPAVCPQHRPNGSSLIVSGSATAPPLSMECQEECESHQEVLLERGEEKHTQSSQPPGRHPGIQLWQSHLERLGNRITFKYVGTLEKHSERADLRSPPKPNHLFLGTPNISWKCLKSIHDVLSNLANRKKHRKTSSFFTVQVQTAWWILRVLLGRRHDRLQFLD